MKQARDNRRADLKGKARSCCQTVFSLEERKKALDEIEDYDAVRRGDKLPPTAAERKAKSRKNTRTRRLEKARDKETREKINSTPGNPTRRPEKDRLFLYRMRKKAEKLLNSVSSLTVSDIRPLSPAHLLKKKKAAELLKKKAAQQKALRKKKAYDMTLKSAQVASTASESLEDCH